ncbi:MAG: class I SAM-dependent methyltransferase [Thermodesulfobacteriota bacterium]
MRNDFLPQSAPLAYREAESLCNGCGWYHGAWQYLRLLGIVSPPYLQNEFYRAAIAPLAASGDYRKVCISGATDYAMADTIIDLWPLPQKAPEVIVVDHCETPLFLNRWYAGRVGIDIGTVCENMLDYRNDGGFDLICTHSFFGFFAPAQRGDLIQNWHRLLRPGGRVVTSNRIRPMAEGRVGFSGQQARDFLTRVMDAGRSFGRFDLAEKELEKMARAYAENYFSYPVTSAEELGGLFTAAGFSLERFDITGRENPVSGPPSTRGKSMRVDIVAVK